MAVRGKVLIVEDDRAICSFMRRVLEANGYESIIVGTGREALSMLTSHCPDVVILDLGLPDMDGMDVLTQLRAWSLMPVVVVSARTDEREKVRALDAGADDYITKPFGTSELLARLRTAIRHTRTTSGNASIAKENRFTARGLVIDYDKYRVYTTAGARPATWVPVPYLWRRLQALKFPSMKTCRLSMLQPATNYIKAARRLKSLLTSIRNFITSANGGNSCTAKAKVKTEKVFSRLLST